MISESEVQFCGMELPGTGKLLGSASKLFTYFQKYGVASGIPLEGESVSTVLSKDISFVRKGGGKRGF